MGLPPSAAGRNRTRVSCLRGGSYGAAVPPAGVTRTTVTSCTPWLWGTNAWRASTSPCASPTSSGSGISTTAWTWMCRWDPAGARLGQQGERSPGVTVPFPAQDILTHIVKKEFQALLAVDQLSLEREKNKVFLRFSECGDKGTAPPSETVAPGPPKPSLCPPPALSWHSPARSAQSLGDMARGASHQCEPPVGTGRDHGPMPPVCPDFR